MPMDAAEVDRLFGPNRKLVNVSESNRYDLKTSMGIVPVEVVLSPDYGVYIRTVVKGELVDVMVLTPYQEDGEIVQPKFRVLVDVNETGSESVLVYLDDVVEKEMQ